MQDDLRAPLGLSVAAWSTATVGFLDGREGWSPLFLAFLGFWLYFAPSLVAWARRHNQLPALIALNLLGGWTALGWIAALVWSLLRSRPITTQTLTT